MDEIFPLRISPDLALLRTINEGWEFKVLDFGGKQVDEDFLRRIPPLTALLGTTTSKVSLAPPWKSPMTKTGRITCGMVNPAARRYRGEVGRASSQSPGSGCGTADENFLWRISAELALMKTHEASRSKAFQESW